MTDKGKAMVLASFAADALALGVHWIYDIGTIERKFGRVERFMEPLENAYHESKTLGAFTHYGDQTLCLLEAVAPCPGFDLNDFSGRWQEMFKDYTGYRDQATKATLQRFDAESDPSASGSASSDLGGAARIGPLIYIYHRDSEKLTESAKAQTAMTHNNPHVIEGAGFFAALAAGVLAGRSPSDGIDDLLRSGGVDESLNEWILEGRKSAELETGQVILNFGQMCDIAAAFPSVIHLISKYETDLKSALIENVMAGGDSAARGMIVGMILGAHLGLDAIPHEWLSEMKAYRRINELLDSIEFEVN